MGSFLVEGLSNPSDEGYVEEGQGVLLEAWKKVDMWDPETLLSMTGGSILKEIRELDLVWNAQLLSHARLCVGTHVSVE